MKHIETHWNILKWLLWCSNVWSNFSICLETMPFAYMALQDSPILTQTLDQESPTIRLKKHVEQFLNFSSPTLTTAAGTTDVIQELWKDCRYLWWCCFCQFFARLFQKVQESQILLQYRQHGHALQPLIEYPTTLSKWHSARSPPKLEFEIGRTRTRTWSCLTSWPNGKGVWLSLTLTGHSPWLQWSRSWYLPPKLETS